MRKFWFCFLVLLAILSCDDGDIITVELDFDGPLALCDNNENDFLVYDVIEDPDEALIFIFDRNNNEDIFLTAIPEDNPREFPIGTAGNRFIYRTYSAEPTFCGILNDNTGIVISNNEADSGTVEVFTTVEDFDEDGIPNDLEGADPNGDGDFSDSLDTDGDGLPNYLDEDDDDDNVLTINEEYDPNGDGDLSDALNTDGDDDPNYLDSDDDGDGVLSRLESEDQDPRTSFNLESPNPNTPRYLDDQSIDEFPEPGFITTRYIRRFTTNFTIKLVDLGVIKFDDRFFGTIETDSIFTINRD